MMSKLWLIFYISSLTNTKWCDEPQANISLDRWETIKLKSEAQNNLRDCCCCTFLKTMDTLSLYVSCQRLPTRLRSDYMNMSSSGQWWSETSVWDYFNRHFAPVDNKTEIFFNGTWEQQVRTFSMHVCGKKTRYFKPKQDLFLTLTVSSSRP